MQLRNLIPNSIFMYILIPVAGAAVVSALLFNLLLTPVFINHFTRRSTADLELATSLGLEHCEENFLNLLSLRLSDDQMMVETMYQESLRGITQIHKQMASVHMLAVSSSGRVDASTYPELPTGSDFKVPDFWSGETRELRVKGQKILYRSAYFPFWRVHIVAVVPLEFISAPVQLMQQGLLIALVAISFILLLTLLITLNYAVKRPLNRVITATREISRGAFPYIESVRKDEIGEVCTAINVMSRQLKENHTALERSIAEKNVLLQEIHHRVKDNLNVVVSLLHLQSDQVENHRQAKEVLNSSCDRIYSMALVHEKLYQSESFSHIDLEAYIQSIADQLFSIYGQNKAIDKIIRGRHIFIDLSVAMPCGLILNELITNSLLHAFPNQNSGKIEIIVEEQAEGNLVLTYSDNGIGIKQEPDFSTPQTTLGLSLIHILGQQLGAKVELNTHHGYWLRLRIPRQGTV
ncbi:MAG: histidine kinase dimerization/phosphoacceptor domain -containing protein [Spirochaetia bacterium]|nr:histidine kinase dimerization/phosphoacceptor domain -containing protein [Spirochaetia bacterium]